MCPTAKTLSMQLANLLQPAVHGGAVEVSAQSSELSIYHPENIGDWVRSLDDVWQFPFDRTVVGPHECEFQDDNWTLCYQIVNLKARPW
jgi:hypothetical protein